MCVAIIKELLLDRTTRPAIFTMLASITVLTTYGVCSSYTAYAIYSSNQSEYNKTPILETSIPAMESITVSNKDLGYGHGYNTAPPGTGNVVNGNKVMNTSENKKSQ